jgi:hypothetical protein
MSEIGIFRQLTFANPPGWPSNASTWQGRVSSYRLITRVLASRSVTLFSRILGLCHQVRD